MQRFLLLLILLLPAGSSHGKSLTFASIRSVQKSLAARRVLEKAWAELGYQLKFVPHPGRRGLVEANAGRIDGLVQRLPVIEKIYPHLRRITPAVSELRITVFSATADFPVRGWSSLPPRSVVILRGVKILEEKTAGMKRLFVDSIHAGFQVLATGRADLGVFAELNGRLMLRHGEFQRIRMLQPPLAQKPMYHYLHRRHVALIPRISATLHKMQAAGTIAVIHTRTTQEMLAAPPAPLPVRQQPADR